MKWSIALKHDIISSTEKRVSDTPFVRTKYNSTCTALRVVPRHALNKVRDATWTALFSKLGFFPYLPANVVKQT